MSDDLVLVVGDQSSNAAPEVLQSVSHVSGQVVRRAGTPLAIDAGQAYYWSVKWQHDQGQSRREITEGKGITFDTADDAIRWLLSPDD